MTYPEFLQELARAGLSVRAFAEMVGMNPNSISNYAKVETVPVHLAVIAVLIGDLAINGLDFRKSIARIDLKPKKPRGAARRGQFGGNRQEILDLEP